MPRQAESMSRLSASVLCERDVEESNHYFALTTDWRDGKVVLSLHYIAVWAEINIQQRTGSWWFSSTFYLPLVSLFTFGINFHRLIIFCFKSVLFSKFKYWFTPPASKSEFVVLQRDFRVIFVYVSSPMVFFKSLCVNVDIFYGFVSLLPCLLFLKCFFFR